MRLRQASIKSTAIAAPILYKEIKCRFHNDNVKVKARGVESIILACRLLSDTIKTESAGFLPASQSNATIALLSSLRTALHRLLLC
jgi:hypothetical protein